MASPRGNARNGKAWKRWRNSNGGDGQRERRHHAPTAAGPGTAEETSARARRPATAPAALLVCVAFAALPKAEPTPAFAALVLDFFSHALPFAVVTAFGRTLNAH